MTQQHFVATAYVVQRERVRLALRCTCGWSMIAPEAEVVIEIREHVAAARAADAARRPVPTPTPDAG